MKRLVALVFCAAAALGGGAAQAVAAEHHPPKFGPRDTQCQAGSNQPNCPGIH